MSRVALHNVNDADGYSFNKVDHFFGAEEVGGVQHVTDGLK